MSKSGLEEAESKLRKAMKTTLVQMTPEVKSALRPISLEGLMVPEAYVSKHNTPNGNYYH